MESWVLPFFSCSKSLHSLVWQTSPIAIPSYFLVKRTPNLFSPKGWIMKGLSQSWLSYCPSVSYWCPCDPVLANDTQGELCPGVSDIFLYNKNIEICEGSIFFPISLIRSFWNTVIEHKMIWVWATVLWSRRERPPVEGPDISELRKECWIHSFPNSLLNNRITYGKSLKWISVFYRQILSNR